MQQRIFAAQVQAIKAAKQSEEDRDAAEEIVAELIHHFEDDPYVMRLLHELKVLMISWR